MQLFIPLYISNLCYNKCTYCGFSVDNKYRRVILNDSQICAEGALLKQRGFDHILLLTGEAMDKAGTDYIANAITLLRPHFSSIGIEVQPMSYDDYTIVHAAGADSLTLFQETYDPDAYAKYHLAGKKRHFANRLNAVEAGASAGFYRITLGALLGLTDWRHDALALRSHLEYLQKKFWRTKYTVSFPRIRDMFNDFEVENHVSDRDIVQFIVAFRLCFPDLGIAMSTREAAEFRDQLLKLGITQLSAESNTAPGGYSGTDTEPQFEISDHRSLSEIKQMITRQGYEPIMKDWDGAFLNRFA
jgi:2-iminoacetate synthase